MAVGCRAVRLFWPTRVCAWSTSLIRWTTKTARAFMRPWNSSRFQFPRSYFFLFFFVLNFYRLHNRPVLWLLCRRGVQLLRPPTRYAASTSLGSRFLRMWIWPSPLFRALTFSASSKMLSIRSRLPKPVLCLISISFFAHQSTNQLINQSILFVRRTRT